MKRIVFLLFLFACVSMQAQNLTIEEVAARWQSRTIKVPGGGEKPYIVKLLHAFHKALPAYASEAVVNLSKDPKFTYMKDEEYENEIIVDRKNGYVCDDAGGTDSSSMEACMWRRTNGHRLFAIVLSQPVDPCIDVVCFYDYDPKTATMTPEEGPLKGFKLKADKFNRYFKLPRTGKDFIVGEYLDDELVEHIFTWDGMNHHFSKTVKRKVEE